MFGYSLENWKKITGSVVYPPRNYPPPPPPTPQIVSPEDLKTTTSTITEYIIGHFRETKTLTFKTRLSAKTIFCV